MLTFTRNIITKSTLKVKVKVKFTLEQALKVQREVNVWFNSLFNLLTPNVNYSGRTAPLTSKVAFYVFVQQI